MTGFGTSLVVKQLGLHAPNAGWAAGGGTRVLSLVRELDPARHN